MKQYKVFDSLGNYLRTFSTYQQASWQNGLAY